MGENVKHTPGPWEVFTVNDEPQMLNFHSAIYGPQGDYDGLFVALANQNGRYESDARLIAAAPELLEACMAFVAYNDMDENDHAALMVAYADMLAKARAAIAKAEGRP